MSSMPVAMGSAGGCWRLAWGCGSTGSGSAAPPNPKADMSSMPVSTDEGGTAAVATAAAAADPVEKAPVPPRTPAAPAVPPAAPAVLGSVVGAAEAWENSDDSGRIGMPSVSPPRAGVENSDDSGRIGPSSAAPALAPPAPTAAAAAANAGARPPAPAVLVLGRGCNSSEACSALEYGRLSLPPRASTDSVSASSTALACAAREAQPGNVKTWRQAQQ